MNDNLNKSLCEVYISTVMLRCPNRGTNRLTVWRSLPPHHLLFSHILSQIIAYKTQTSAILNSCHLSVH